MRKCWRIGFTIAAFGWTTVFPQDISLDSLVRMGIRNNPEFLVSREESEVAASDTLNSTIFRNPELSLEAGYNVTDPGKPKAAVRLAKDFQPGVRNNQYRVSQANLTAKRQSQKSRELDITAEIRSIYFKWQILDRKKLLQSETGKRWESLSRLALAKLKEGRISQVDEAQAQLSRARARQREMVLQSEMGAWERRLNYLTGRSIPIDSLTRYRVDSLPEIPAEDSLYLWASHENQELKALNAEIEIQKRQSDLENALSHPPVTLSLGYEREAEGSNIVGGGLALPLQIFNRNQAGIARSRAGLRLADARVKAAEARIHAEVAELRGRLENLAERYRAYQKEIRALGAKQMELSEKGFLQGQLGIFDLSRVQEEFLSQEQDALDILDTYYDQWNRLGKAVGGKTW
jgi:cobalt-zinc-cadmium efflux system outer membrane protein